MDDFNKDGNLDALIAGNLHASEVETPRNDAGVGLLLEGNGKGAFDAIPARESGLLLSGDVKDMTRIKVNNDNLIVVAKNSDSLQVVKIHEVLPQ